MDELDQQLDSESSNKHETKFIRNKLQVIYQQNPENTDDILRGGGPCTDKQAAVVIDIKTNKRWCIERVPPHVREVDEKAYTPKILSIGPFHHKKPGLEAMEFHKLRFLKRLEAQISSLNLEHVMKDVEKSTRECYSEEFEQISSEDFVRMLVLDACFIVELFRLHEKGLQGENVDEPIFGTRWMLPIIGRDLLLMENQLPMFILQKVFVLTNFNDENQAPLNKLALKFFKSHLRPHIPDELPSQGIMSNTTEGSSVGFDNLLALFQSTLFQSSFVPRKTSSIGSSIRNSVGSYLSCYNVGNGNSLPRINNVGNSLLPDNKDAHKYLRLPLSGWVQNAKTLSWAGIKFSSQEDGDRGLVVEFKGNKLKIPALLLGDDIYVHLLRNMLAYEQSNTDVPPYVTCFATFLGSLVATPEDIKILIDKGIIKHAKGRNVKIVNLIKSLSWDVHRFDMIKDCYMAKQIKQINRFSQPKRGKIRRAIIAALKKFA